VDYMPRRRIPLPSLGETQFLVYTQERWVKLLASRELVFHVIGDSCL
jgi:hypothetical protein